MDFLPLRILTYNIHKGFSIGNRRFVLHQIREQLRHANVDIVFRPELVGVSLGDQPSDRSEVRARHGTVNELKARVGKVDFTGDHLKVHFETADGEVTAKLAPDLVLPEGGEVTLLIKAEHCVAQRQT